MNYNKSFCTLIILQLFSICLYSQNFGGHACNEKWYNINSKNVRLIYPDGLQEQAKRVASIIDHIKANNTYSVGDKSKKIDILLHSNQVISNGFVRLAPYVSEFFCVGMQNMNRLGSIDWLDGLAIHEYRHSLQFNNSRRGYTKIASYIQGQLGWAGAANFSIPSWYFEGDAVLSETLLSEAGRGRTPSFYKELRANLLNNKNYRYMTSRNGSFNKMLPNIYPLGFVICNYTRNEYGMDIWAKILADAGRYRTVFYPFSGAMKRHTGVRTRKMYKKAFAQLKSDWEEELKSIKITPLEVVSPKPKRTVTTYQYPHFIDDGSIIAIKSSYKETPCIVKINNGIETKIISYGISQSKYLSVNKDRLAWVEFQKNPRRGGINYNKIVSFDLSNSTKRIICDKTRYFSPSISPDGDKIAVVEISKDAKNRIVILDSNTGDTISSLTNKRNDFVSFPKWTKDNKSIVYIAKRNSKLALLKIDISSHKITKLTEWSSNVIGELSVGNNYVYFSASYSGIDNIYAVDLSGNKEIKQLTSVKVGVYQPAISAFGNKLIMSKFTPMGYELAQLSIDKNIEKYPTIECTEPINQSRYKIKTNEYEKNILNNVKKLNYTEKPYKGFFKGMKFHSWFITGDEYETKLDILMNNTLNNLRGIFGAKYNSNEKTFGYNANVLYGKYFVEIGLDAKFSQRKSIFLVKKEIKTYNYNESDIKLFLNLPLSWTKGQYFIGWKTSVGMEYVKLFKDNEEFQFKYPNFTIVDGRIKFKAIRRTAYQNLQPRWGMNLDVSCQKSVSSLFADKLYVYFNLFLPSVFSNHGFRIAVNWQKENADNDYKFTDNFAYSRGYSALASDQIYRFSFNYSFPLLYPNWGFGGITYFKRVRANLFYDMSQSKLNKSTTNMNSYGVEIIFDNTFFNILPVSLGLRESFLLNTDLQNPNRTNFFEVFVSLNLGFGFNNK